MIYDITKRPTMKIFKEYITEQKNTHMTHIEDLVLDGGVRGARDAINALRSLRDMLAGNAKTSHDVTVKWDGAPAVFAGIDPTDGKFFVAKKGIFNKNPMVYKTPQDIDDDIGNPDLNIKMQISLEELSKLGIRGVVQGDIMFTDGDIKSENIDGSKYITFHPNTIMYAVPEESKLAKTIMKARIGIVWHTTYNGSTFEDMSADYGVDVTKFKKVSSVWSQDAAIRDLSGTATMTSNETKEVTRNLSIAGRIFRKIASNTLRDLENMKELNQMVNTFNNTYVRRGERIRDTGRHVQALQMYIEDKYDSKIDGLKSEKGKDNWRTKKAETMKFFSRNSIASIKAVFDLQSAIVDAKMVIIDKLNTIQNIDTFVKTKNGFKVTGSEGFVSIDRFAGTAVKLVDRLEFSTNNFSPDVIKGWESSSRS